MKIYKKLIYIQFRLNIIKKIQQINKHNTIIISI